MADSLVFIIELAGGEWGLAYATAEDPNWAVAKDNYKSSAAATRDVQEALADEGYPLGDIYLFSKEGARER